MTDSSHQYLKEHNISQIFEYLCAQLVYSKPADPLPFIANELRKLQAQSNGGTTGAGLSLFSSSDYEVMFSMLDPLNKGVITQSQVSKAVQELGLDQGKVRGEIEKKREYDVETFKKICQLAAQ